MLLIFLSCCWILGIYIGSEYELPPFYFLLAGAPLAMMIFHRAHRRRLLLACLGIVIFMGAATYSYSSLHKIDEGHLHFYNDRGVIEIEGVVAGDPDVRDTGTRITLKVSRIKLEDSWRGATGTALLFISRYPAYRYGDVLHVTGEPETPESSGNFDYRGYLEHRGIRTIIYYPRIEITDTGKGSVPLAWIYSLRGRLAGSISAALPEPQAALAQGILLGIRSNIPDELTTAFSRSGTSHLLAISGLHLSIMAGIFLAIGLWLFGRRHNLYVWLAMGAIWFYTLITGMSPPVWRGAVMVSLFLIAELLGRQRSAIVGLVVAAAIITGFQPYILGDVSFQLSFLAMVGLIFITPGFRKLGRSVTVKWFGEEGSVVSIANLVVDALAATLGAIIAVWPVVAYYFGIVSLVGPFATLLTVPVLPVILVFGMLAAFAGLALPAAGHIIGWLVWLFLSYLILIVKISASLSISFIQFQFPAALIWVYYPVLAGIGWFIGRKYRLSSRISGSAGRMKAGINLASGVSSRAMWLVTPLFIGAVLVSYTAFTFPDNSVRVSFLDVGEGDAILIQKGNRQVLVDGGPDPQVIRLALSKHMSFWDRSIDMLVLTHPHQDHLAGLVEVLQCYDVKEVLYPDIAYASPLYDEWRRLLEEKDINTTIAVARQQLVLGEDIGIDVLGPLPESITGGSSDIDDNGVVLRVTCGRVSFLLAADIGEETERILIRQRAELDADVLKVAHHGSDTSSTDAFLSVVTPQIAVISCGEGNRYEHPDPGTLARLEAKVGADNLFRTDENGTIEFIVDDGNLRVNMIQ